MEKAWKLRKSNIFVKLMKFTWGLDYKDFQWMCIFTWLSVFNVVILPITIVVKLIIAYIYKPINKILISLEKRAEEKDKEWARNNFFRAVAYTNPSAYDFGYLDRATSEQRRAFFALLRETNMSLYQRLSDAFHSRKETKYVQIAQIKERKRKTRKEALYTAMKFIKPIATAVLWLLAGFLFALLGFGLYKLYIFLSHTTGKDWMGFFVGIGILVGIVLGIFLAIRIFVNSDTEPTKAAKITGKIISTPFIFLWGVVCTFCKLIKQTISDNCPAIEWKD